MAIMNLTKQYITLMKKKINRRKIKIKFNFKVFFIKLKNNQKKQIRTIIKKINDTKSYRKFDAKDQ